MTKIGGAQRGLNTAIDHITAQLNAQNALLPKEGNSDTGFDSHLMSFDLNANQDRGASEANIAPDNSSDKAAPKSTGNTLSSSISTLFAGLANDSQSNVSDTNAAAKKTASAADAETNLATPTAQSTHPADSTLALLAAFTTGNQAGAVNPNLHPSPPGYVSTPTLPKSGSQLFSSKSSETDGAQKSAKSPARTSPVPAIHTSDPASSSPDLSVSAQATMAMLSASLTSQNAGPTPSARKEPSASNTNSNSLSSRLQPSSAAFGLERLDKPAANGLQSDTTDTPARKQTLDPSQENAEFDLSTPQTIKMNASSIQAQTHFAPVMHLSPTDQIAGFVAASIAPSSLSDGDGASGSNTAVSNTAASAATLPQTASSSMAPVKTLTLALEPDNLGTITIKMRLVDSGLELQVEAAKSETTSLIEKDKANLSNKLESLGYAVDSLVVNTAPQQGTNLDTSNQNAPAQGQQTTNESSASGLDQNGGGNSNDQSPARRNRDATTAQEKTVDLSVARNLGDGLYV